MKPNWLKITLPQGSTYNKIRAIVKEYNLHTVCEQARCPNIGKCWAGRTVTFMILGDTCTRNCKFCAVKTGNPKGIVDKEEPKRVAQAVKNLALNYVVITSVTRDDLTDGGASIFAQTIKQTRKLNPNTKIEVLIPDFAGSSQALKTVLLAKPDVLAHNLETVARLTPLVRDKRANYQTSLNILRLSKDTNPDIPTKSGIMVGLGEEEEEVKKTMLDLKMVGTEIITIGQYLKPSPNNWEVGNYISPEKFQEFRQYGKALGFRQVLAGPLVRSSLRFAY
jgi:lipoic acid synthetase|uniref:Lipoyl synthase n=1 Tax=candidate division WOR-3 bacterium TaxID=2052148 RepID=A0A7C6AA69_UNCW3